ncbi:MAG: Gfo/Idh/MocA family oxidoreductase [Bacteroidales bacterium]|jgi:predicted dehydrogenase|nr:Gfo/Idh/MocA family oxidoreductase [Bacteroidales bacterium]
MKHGFGIIGAGAIAEVHARAIDTIMDAELVGVYDHDPDKTIAFSTKFRCKAYESAEKLCNDDRIEIVNICTPSGKHLEPALTAINAGKGCVIEKPLEITLERCDRIINAAIERNVMVSGIFPMRFSRVNIELKKAIDEGRFGKLVMGDAYIKWYRSAEYYSDVRWRSLLNTSGGGAVMNQGIHSIDLLRWFMGKVDSVCAFTGLVGHENLEVEDVATATVKFANGAMGVIEASTAVHPGFFRRIEILGTRGSAIIEEEKLIAWNFDEERDSDRIIREKYSGNNQSGGGVSDPKAISDIGHLRQLLDIIQSIDKGLPPPVDAIEAKKAVELVLAIYASASNKRIVYL